MSAARKPRQTMLDWALAYAAKGIPVFPLIPRAKEPLIKGGQGYKDATTDAAQIRAWWAKEPNAGIGIPMVTAGLLALDIDPRNGGDYDALTARYGELPQTLTSQTGGGGLHLLFRHPGGELRAHVPDMPGIDVKVNGYIVAPPSIHPSGTAYQWLGKGGTPLELPAAYIALLRRPDRVMASNVTPMYTGKPDEDTGGYWLDKAMDRRGASGDDNTGFWLAQQLLVAEGTGKRVDVLAMLQTYAEFATRDSSHPFDDEDANRWLRSARESQIVKGGEPAVSQKPRPIRPLQKRPASITETSHSHSDYTNDGGDTGEPETTSDPIHFTDMGNARRFVGMHGKDVRFVASWNKWLIWDGRRWRMDGTGESSRRAKTTVRAMYAESSESEDEQTRKELAKWAMKSEADARIKAMLSQVQTEPEIAAESDAFDNQPWLLTVLNGTVNLKTGTFMPHLQTHRITRLAPVEYDPKAQCPIWLKFLDRIMGGNEQLIGFLQRAIGYSLTDSTDEQVLFLMHGNGQNGKSKFLEAIEGVVGDYGMQTPTSTLMAKRDNNIPNDVARLKGARFVKAIETEEGHALAESLVKQMTGGDMVSARFMRGEWFDFKPAFKLWLAANHLPTIRGTDDGIWRRIRYIPFEVQIPDAEKDEKLGAKLKAEYPGILAWAVQGCLAWQRDGLGYPDEVRKATQGYRDQMDHFGRYLDECCDLTPKAECTAKVLRQSYEQWCQDNGERPKSQVWVGKELQGHSVKRERDSGGATVYVGIRLRSQQA